jgi:trehalose 6-phosphate synthase/phosphatase
MPRLITISNRLPISVKLVDDNFVYTTSVGGLATGLSSTDTVKENYWVGWPGSTIEAAKDQAELKQKLNADNMQPVFLTDNEYDNFYEGFSNKTIWPLFHYFTQYTTYKKSYWEYYRKVNQLFCDEIKKIAQPDDVFWVHDYQLMLLPGMLREIFPDATIGFFLHIPFPSYEIFRTLPWRKEVLQGILGSDLVGFHTFDYMRHFLSAATRILDLNHHLGRINMANRVVEVDSFPMGIDYDKFANAVYEKETIKEIIELRQQLGKDKIILSVDRLDYSKGILERITAFERFLGKYPEYQGQVTLLVILVPSRAGVDQYQNLKEQIDEAVGRINGKYNTLRWSPIHYFYRALPFHTLAAIYYMSDVALITPLRDGMNLIAKEYIASKTDQTGVLILSEMAGAAKELTEAIHVNPSDWHDIVRAIHTALTMPQQEQIKRNAAMQQTLKRYNVKRWSQVFMDRLREVRMATEKIKQKQFSDDILARLTKSYNESDKRLFLLDYDGTLVDFQDDPQKVVPDEYLYNLLKKLSNHPENSVVVISGRDKDSLERWLGKLHIGIIAEHGVWSKEPSGEWTKANLIDQEWKQELKGVMETFVDRTPGTFIEVKDYSLVWHYRKADQGLAEIRVHELIETLSQYTSRMRLQILEGNKVIEIKNAGINKGHAAEGWAQRNPDGFILAIGDDYTDEDTFKAVGSYANAYTIKVGHNQTAAHYNIDSNRDVLRILHVLSEQQGIASDYKKADMTA